MLSTGILDILHAALDDCDVVRDDISTPHFCDPQAMFASSSTPLKPKLYTKL